MTLALAGLAGVVGAWWIAVDFTHKTRAFVYHEPIFIIYVGVFADVVAHGLRTRRPALLLGLLLASALTAGRYFLQWPFSGHGLLGAFYAAVPLRKPWRLLGVGLMLLAWIFKLIVEPPWIDAWTGAAVGLAVAALTRRIDRDRRPQAA